MVVDYLYASSIICYYVAQLYMRNRYAPKVAHRYVQLAQTTAIPRHALSRSKSVLRSLRCEDELDLDALRRLVQASVGSLTERSCRTQERSMGIGAFQYLGSGEHGWYSPPGYPVEAHGIDRVLKTLLRSVPYPNTPWSDYCSPW